VTPGKPSTALFPAQSLNGTIDKDIKNWVFQMVAAGEVMKSLSTCFQAGL